MTLNLPGINIQYPWAGLILDGIKTVETRKYPLPEKFRRQRMWLIETPGRFGKFKARVVGVVCFGRSFRYDSLQTWWGDAEQHRCFIGSHYDWDGVSKKYGWRIVAIASIKPFDAAPMSRGIVYSSLYESECDVIYG